MWVRADRAYIQPTPLKKRARRRTSALLVIPFGAIVREVNTVMSNNTLEAMAKPIEAHESVDKTSQTKQI